MYSEVLLCFGGWHPHSKRAANYDNTSSRALQHLMGCFERGCLKNQHAPCADRSWAFHHPFQSLLPDQLVLGVALNPNQQVSESLKKTQQKIKNKRYCSFFI